MPSMQAESLIDTGPALGGAGPNREQFRSAQVPSQLAPRSVECGSGAQLGAIGPIGLRPTLVRLYWYYFIISCL